MGGEMSDTCKVVFFGELQSGFQPDQVIEAFSEKFSVRREKAEKLINASKEVVLKGGLNEERAEKYKKVLEKIGLVVRIEGKSAELSSTGLTLESMDEETDDATVEMQSAPKAAVISKCPKCGAENIADGSCMECGVVVAKYLAIKSRMADDADEEEWQATPENPYNTPSADLLEAQDGEMSGPHKVPTGHALAWIGKGWWHFKQSPLAWILALVVWFAMAFVIGLVPLLGGIAINLLTPVIVAGFSIGCRAQDDGEDFTVAHVFAGFSNNTGQLVLVGLIYFGAIFLLTIGMMFGVFSVIGLDMMASQDPERMMGTLFSPALLIILLVGLLLFVPLVMSFFFAPVLIALDDIKALAAMKLSFMGCLQNILPMFVYSLLAILLIFIASIPLFLGLLVVLPILTASLYAAYRDIYYS
jgi:uncharacterized membrane protein